MKKYIRTLLIVSLFFLGVGGEIFHLSFHTFTEHSFGFVPLITGILSIAVIPILFAFRKSLNIAYLLNGFTVIIGTITMAHFSFVKGILIADIIVLFAKLTVGRAIFCLELYPLDAQLKTPGLKYFRWPNMGFWYVHLVALSLVYYLGNLLWR